VQDTVIFDELSHANVINP